MSSSELERLAQVMSQINAPAETEVLDLSGNSSISRDLSMLSSHGMRHTNWSSTGSASVFNPPPHSRSAVSIVVLVQY